MMPASHVISTTGTLSTVNCVVQVKKPGPAELEFILGPGDSKDLDSFD